MSAFLFWLRLHRPLASAVLLQGFPGSTGEKGDVGERGEKVDVQQGGRPGASLLSMDRTIRLAPFGSDQSPPGTRGGSAEHQSADLSKPVH